jgi:hypothetical protein
MSKPIPHGTANGYCNYRCRCSECKNAWRQYARDRVDAWRHRKVGEGLTAHGKPRKSRLSVENLERMLQASRSQGFEDGFKTGVEFARGTRS